ncbi:nodal modulator 3-like [Dreissena polymorpha]|uniref:nodal modulator 3-like n=1 Tax=Dreissena polymorpha TaxID=45954 RepID=UPI002264A35B|nr:nodal modulator 3-like [Dreissena polymorpha]
MMSRRVMMRTLVYLLLILIHFSEHVAGDIVGCGGFVKSDVDINFSLVEVKLYTPHGSIKYQTDCAPNTGYYLIPLYDKGDFILKVEPPAGWTFEPAKVELKVDGETDPCSLGQDINFVFTGFSLNGKVISKGQVSGPAGVPVNLHKSGSTEVLQTVQTTNDGSYQFTKVMPGKYDVKAQATNYRFEKSETVVELSQGNGEAGSSLVIAGYAVTGKVVSEGEPIKGVNFLLYSATVSAQNVLDCDKSTVSGQGKTENFDPLCHVTSDTSGKFVFPCLPTGDYYLIPFYKGEHITFDVVPEKLPFQVEHSALQLKTTFQVAGFSVSGQVLHSVKGQGIIGAKVLLNGQLATTTSADGVYHLENMKTGTYKLLVQADHMTFLEREIRITPNTPQLPDIFPDSFSLCGTVTIEKFPDSLVSPVTKRKMIIFPEGKGSAAVSKETDDSGHFCTSVQPGKYIVRVHISDVEVKAGLTIAPAEQLVTIIDRPVLDIVFSQFRAKVTGSITCIEKCGPVEISLDAVGRSDKQIAQTQGNQKLSSFVFENVLPGKYKATVMRDNLCWKDKTIEFEVTNSNKNDINFVQTGYILKCTISHPVTLHFAQDQRQDTVGSFELNKGKNRFCLAQPGLYQLRPDSCHKFERAVYSYDTSNPETLTLTAVSHLVLGTITTEQPVKDVIVTVESLHDQSVTSLGPLSTEQPALTGNQSTMEIKGPQTYRFSHWAKTGEALKVSVKSSEMLYKPPVMQATVSGESCPGEMFKFVGERGQFIVGHVVPKLTGVKIVVSDPKGTMEPVVDYTSENGDFKIGPLHKGHDFVVVAEKEGYVMEKEPGESAVFRARQLSRIEVKITDDKGAPLSAVLLSLSGEKQYRSNNLTHEDGIMIFIGLSPGQYFLRPMMKEYNFDPVSRMIDVTEGTTVKVDIRGSRTAYSCYGAVTSLNGEPEPGVFVEALGKDECSMYQEESKTEPNGHYRIRGLQPNCRYEVRLKIGDMNKHIERAAPKSRLVVVENADFNGVDIIAFRRMNQMDISGNVITDPENLATLKVRLYREDNPGVPLTTVNLGVVSFFYLPSLQMDDATYIVKLESTLSKTSYEFDQPEIELKANLSYKHITFTFKPKRKTLEQELNQSSVLMLPFTVLVIVALYNYQKLLPLGKQLYSQVQVAVQNRQNAALYQQQAQQHEQQQQQYSLLHDLDDSPMVRKKSKPRKT